MSHLLIRFRNRYDLFDANKIYLNNTKFFEGYSMIRFDCFGGILMMFNHDGTWKFHVHVNNIDKVCYTIRDKENGTSNNIHNKDVKDNEDSFYSDCNTAFVIHFQYSLRHDNKNHYQDK